MKKTIQKSINVLDNLVTTYVVIKNKINENVLNQQNYQQLENRLNNLEKLFSDNSSGDSSAPYIEASVDVQQINATTVPIVVHYQAVVKNAPDGAKPTVQAYDVDYDRILDEGELNTSDQTFTFSETMWFPGTSISGTIRLIFTYEGAETVNIDISYSFSFPEVQIIVESPITITGTVGTEIEPCELNVTINSPDGIFTAFPTGNLPSGIDFVDNKIVGIPQNVESGSFEITVQDPTQTTSKTIVVNYTFAAAQSDKTYVYTVSGFTDEYADANGDYWDTGDTSADQPIYYNGKKYLLKGDFVGSGNNDYWGFCDNNTVESVDFFSSGADVTAITTWYDNGGAIEITGVTVKPYTTSGSTNKTYVYNVSGAGTTEANGDYWDTGEIINEKPVYTNGNTYLYYYGYEWTIDEDTDPSNGYLYNQPTGDANSAEGNWTEGYWDGTYPGPIVTKY